MQVVTLALYVYFATTLLGRQWLDPTRDIPGYKVSSQSLPNDTQTTFKLLFLDCLGKRLRLLLPNIHLAAIPVLRGLAESGRGAPQPLWRGRRGF